MEVIFCPILHTLLQKMSTNSSKTCGVDLSKSSLKAAFGMHIAGIRPSSVNPCDYEYNNVVPFLLPFLTLPCPKYRKKVICLFQLSLSLFTFIDHLLSIFHTSYLCMSNAKSCMYSTHIFFPVDKRTHNNIFSTYPKHVRP